MAKARSIVNRSGRLADWARAERPDVALSHNSYAQIVAARRLGVPPVTAMDYEHQPANHLAFRLAQPVMLPAALADAGVRSRAPAAARCASIRGSRRRSTSATSSPTASVLASLGSSGARHSGRRRPHAAVGGPVPPVRAIRCSWRRCGPSRACPGPLRGARPPRRAARGPRRARAPQRGDAGARPRLALADARGDLMVGAGGTMTREGALMGVPTVSMFAGRRPAVDRWLEERGALRRVENGQGSPAVRAARPGPATRPSCAPAAIGSRAGSRRRDRSRGRPRGSRAAASSHG